MALLSYAVRHMPVGHCARGPQRCPRCAADAQHPRWCLLQLGYPALAPDQPIPAMPVIEVADGSGQTCWMPYRVVAALDTEAEANARLQKLMSGV